MIVVTGGAGFIGSNLVRALNARGETDILVVEDLADGRKALNLADCCIADYLDREHSLALLEAGRGFSTTVRAVIHLGACSDTTEWDGRHMMALNFRYSRALLDYCVGEGVPLVYASSAAVYGAGKVFDEHAANEAPLNVYGYSKLAFDQHVRHRLAGIKSTVIGLRYFNVFGRGEQHKGRMASVVWHFSQQLREHGVLRLFGASHGFAAGEQRRDFISVDDAVAVTLWAAEQGPEVSGIYNCGTGVATTFNEVAESVIAASGGGSIEYIDFPEALLPAYQAHTQADLTRLRAAGYDAGFSRLDSAIKGYLRWLGS